MTKEERREYYKKYYAEHQEKIKSIAKKWREEHVGYMKKYYAENREEHKEYLKKYRSEHREECNARMRKVLSEDLNKNGTPKSHIRTKSNHVLLKCHAKLPGYEIHHCFGYEDPEKFIYISKSLHLQIHQLLRDKKIPADTDHWKIIRDLVNACEEYTYIRA